MTTISSENARTELAELIKQVSESHEPIPIMSGTRTALLVAEEDWRAIQETFYLLTIPNMRESILEGLKTPVEDCFEEPGW